MLKTPYTIMENNDSQTSLDYKNPWVSIKFNQRHHRLPHFRHRLHPLHYLYSSTVV